MGLHKTQAFAYTEIAIVLVLLHPTSTELWSQPVSAWGICLLKDIADTWLSHMDAEQSYRCSQVHVNSFSQYAKYC